MAAQVCGPTIPSAVNLLLGLEARHGDLCPRPKIAIDGNGEIQVTQQSLQLHRGIAQDPRARTGLVSPAVGAPES